MIIAKHKIDRSVRNNIGVAELAECLSNLIQYFIIKLKNKSFTAGVLRIIIRVVFVKFERNCELSTQLKV